jgi:hypothetical protein
MVNTIHKETLYIIDRVEGVFTQKDKYVYMCTWTCRMHKQPCL